MPLRLGVDAAILFSDITLIALGFGLDLEFQEGPVITPRVTPELSLPFLPEKLSPATDAVKIVKSETKTPLIGFCGGPFTVATYLSDAKSWLYADPAAFHRFLSQITDLSIAMLQSQIEAGVDAVQIFDSWAAELTREQFQLFAAPYLKRIIGSLSVPVIFFMRGGSWYIDELFALNCALSCDWQQPLFHWRKKGPLTPLQGNLDPDILFASPDIVRQKTREILDSMANDPRFILNLGHGVKPKTPVESVRAFIEASCVAGKSL